MTAIILYCNGDYKPNVLTLYVAPFLKEHTKMGGVVKRGNYPVNIFEQLKSLSVSVWRVLQEFQEMHYYVDYIVKLCF